MNWINVILTSLSMSVDAMTISAVDGLQEKNMRKTKTISIALLFGLMQFLMPVIGYFIGYSFKDALEAYIPWIAFALLSLLGIKSFVDWLKDRKKEKEEVKRNHIYGIEADDTAFGLSTTNMLIHGDGNSNVYQDSCFNRFADIEEWNIDRVLMNPPYNAAPKRCKPSYVASWGKDKKQDPSKGFHFVYEIAKHVKTGKLAVLLPMQCAIGSDKEIKKFKQLMLQEHHLDAVFSLPSDIFHPGANACACCMIFDLGVKHEKAPIKETFFGYFKDDGFVKRKNLGRVEKTPGVWKEKEALWLDLYRQRNVVVGLSAIKEVSYKDEWLAEAYMETDYSDLKAEDFEKTVRQYLSFLILNGETNE